MKKLIVLTITLLCFLQVFPQSFTDITVQSSLTSTSPAIVSLPKSYSDSTNKKYPLVIFFHGIGEASQTRNDVLLERTGLPQLISQGQVPKAVSPIDGKTYEFIVVCPQHSYATFGIDGTPSAFKFILDDVIKKYRIDTTRIYVTGLSIGAQATVSSVTWNTTFAKRIAAIYPIALTGLGLNGGEADSILYIGEHYGVPASAIVGTNDVALNGYINTYAITKDFIVRYNSTTPNPLGVFTEIVGGGHDAVTWNTAYDLSWRNNSYHKNIYEWFLQYQKNSSPAVALPLKLISFTSEKANKSVLLKYSVTDAVKIDIERSSDGVSFNYVGTGSLTQFVDNTPKPGKNYYRLKMYDANDDYVYSFILAITINGSNKTIKAVLYNVTGQQLKVGILENVDSWKSELKTSGVYFIKYIPQDTNTYIERYIKE
jgi:hypothetical protein